MSLCVTTRVNVRGATNFPFVRVVTRDWRYPYPYRWTDDVVSRGWETNAMTLAEDRHREMRKIQGVG